MYAVVRTGGKQYRVEAGSTLLVEKLVAEPGSSITFDRVLLVGDGETVKVGTPTVSGASVTATVLGEERGQKIVVFKFKQKVKYRRRTGHRQHLTRLRVDAITADGKTERVAEKPAAATKSAAAETPAAATTDEKPSATRTRRAAKRQTDAPAAVAADAAPEPVAETEAKPARRSRAKARVAEPTPEEAAPDASASDADAEKSATPPKPRARRSAKPKTESAKED